MTANRVEPVMEKRLLVALMAAGFSSGSWAVTDFEFGDGWKGQWTTSASVGTSVRAESPDPSLYGQGNGALVGLPNGTGNNTIDEGNLNYRKGDRFSTLFDLALENRIPC